MSETKDVRDLKRKLEAKQRKVRRLELAIPQGEATDYPGRGGLVCALCKKPTLDHPVAVMCGIDWIPKEKS